MRWAAAVEYDGSAFRGWQQQKDAASVQSVVEAALTQVADHPVNVVCAGRTDAGVHAVGQVIHFDTHAERPAHAWLLGVNTHLPDTVSIPWFQPVPDDFNARFSATGRAYRYLIYPGRVCPALLRHRVAWIKRELAVEPMQIASAHLVGEHDFTSFRAVACQAKHARREVRHIHIQRMGELIVVDIQANAFLHHMVRNIVGTLMVVGRGEASPNWVAEVLAARDRTRAGITAPADGLYLTRVFYPEAFALPPTRPAPVYA